LQEKGIKYAMSSKKINQDAITLYILEKYWQHFHLNNSPYQSSCQKLQIESYTPSIS
jgi:hypothetical protein